jgi:hypothetical protein
MTKTEVIKEIGMGKTPKGWRREEDYGGWRKGKTRIGDREVFDWIQDHTCAICGDGPDLDIRYLRIGCFYDLTEISRKFQYNKEHNNFILPFCKPCRGHFMSSVLEPWVNSKGHKEHQNWNGESNIQFV